MFTYFWEREHKQGKGREREGDTESEAGSRLWAVSTEPDAGLEPARCWLWPEPKLDAQSTEPSRSPKCLFYFWKRERESMSRGRAERDWETEDLKQALYWQQRAQCRTWTHKRWDHDLSWSWMLNRLSPPGDPDFTDVTFLPSRDFQVVSVIGSLPLKKCSSSWYYVFSYY